MARGTDGAPIGVSIPEGIPLRLFFAIEVPDDARHTLAGFASSLAGKLRCVPPEQIHLTLKFLGDVPDEDLPVVVDAATAALTGPAFALRVAGGGSFGPPTQPRVLWAATTGEVRRAVGVFRALDRAMRHLGHPPEQRTFTPHLTLARVQGRVPGATLERLRSGVPELPLPVSEITLFRSDLLPGGARHTAIHRFALRTRG